MTARRPTDKLLDRDALVARFGPTRAGTVVFTNGCFDLLHPGHVRALSDARALGDALVVGVNSDASVRRLGKGTDRPLVGERDRAVVVAALESVDAVCLFDEDTPTALIEAVRPDVLVKGGDYEEEQVTGRDIVTAYGGSVVVSPFVEGYSTTALVARIRTQRGQTDE